MTETLPKLEELWEADPPGHHFGTYDPSVLDGLPPVARRYLAHAIEPGAPLHQAARLTMHGEIKLDKWYPFKAEQVVRVGRGFIWRAKARMAPLVSVKGSDAFVDGIGQMRWKVLGLIPVMTGDGPDISRSAAARAQLETLLMPSALLHESVHWSAEQDDEHALVTIDFAGYQGCLRLCVDHDGRLLDISTRRWGNPDGGQFQEHDFGGYFEEEARFGPFTVCKRIRCGWYFGSDRYAEEGEFFHGTIDDIVFR